MLNKSRRNRFLCGGRKNKIMISVICGIVCRSRGKKELFERRRTRGHILIVIREKLLMKYYIPANNKFLSL